MKQGRIWGTQAPNEADLGTDMPRSRWETANPFPKDKVVGSPGRFWLQQGSAKEEHGCRSGTGLS